jgi:hypothetical protein
MNNYLDIEINNPASRGIWFHAHAVFNVICTGNILRPLHDET